MPPPAIVPVVMASSLFLYSVVKSSVESCLPVTLSTLPFIPLGVGRNGNIGLGNGLPVHPQCPEYIDTSRRREDDVTERVAYDKPKLSVLS